MRSSQGYRYATGTPQAYRRFAYWNNISGTSWWIDVWQFLHIIRCPSGVHPRTGPFQPSNWLDYGTNCSRTWGSCWQQLEHRPWLRRWCHVNGWTDRDVTTLQTALAKFFQTDEDLGLHLSWQKTEVQNLSFGDPVADITVANNTTEAVTEFRYLSFIQSSSGRCYPDLRRRIEVAFSVMH